MPELPGREIAARYLPDRNHYWYTRSKLAMDPLYGAVVGSLRGYRTPLLDVGCGIGILAHCLRASGHEATYIGVDSDEHKLAAARDSAACARLKDAAFRQIDLSCEFPEHSGSVVLLDVLQYLQPDAQQTLIARAASCLTSESILVMRGGLDDGGWRAALTRTADRFGHAVRWMRSSFKAQLQPQELADLLSEHRLSAEFRPLWGRTPFNNWLITARLMQQR